MNLKQAKELVRSRLSDKRYEHTINVKKMAVKLAKHYGADEEQAALAALLHDAAKEISKDEMCAIMQAHPEYAEGGEARPTPVWHGVCASILARTEWGVTDEAVLSAIACHTAGKPGMTQLDKILYLADMTSAERDWPGVEKLRKLELKDLDAAMLAALKQTNDFVLSGQTAGPHVKSCLRGYSGPQCTEWGKRLKPLQGRAAKPIADSAGRCYTMTYDRFCRELRFLQHRES